MSSWNRSNYNGLMESRRIIQENHASVKLTGKALLNSMLILGFILYLIYILFPNHPCCYSFTVFTHIMRPKLAPILVYHYSSPTNISHIAFGIASSEKTWRMKRDYIEAWWRPNVTRGYVFLDRRLIINSPASGNDLPSWPASSPPFLIYKNTSSYAAYDKHPIPHAIRMTRMIIELFEAENEDVRWYVMSDDDTVFFINNLVDVLARYDHTKYFYIGMNSETFSANNFHSFHMAFGGGGYVLSYPLAKALVTNLDVCIKRYQTLYGSDHMVQSCAADLGVSLTYEKGFHQVDLHNDISGFLSAHPQSPVVSLHHFEAFDPIFPSMKRKEAVKHLMKAAKADESILLQQTICYYKPKNWSFSISRGYSTQVYESIYPPSFLQRPLQTFAPWNKLAKPFYIIDTRLLSKNPCEIPHVFYFDSVEEIDEQLLSTSYVIRGNPRRLPACSSSGSHSAGHLTRILVISPVKKHIDQVGSRRDCCDIKYEPGLNTTEIRVRTCIKNEIIP